MGVDAATRGVATHQVEHAGAGVALRAEGLTKRFGALTAVDGLSLEVYEGEVLGLLGPNGAGKTTSIGMVCGLLRPDAGHVLIHGVPIDPEVGAWRKVNLGRVREAVLETLR